jgi:hypothetical protein
LVDVSCVAGLADFAAVGAVGTDCSAVPLLAATSGVAEVDRAERLFRTNSPIPAVTQSKAKTAAYFMFPFIMFHFLFKSRRQ